MKSPENLQIRILYRIFEKNGKTKKTKNSFLDPFKGVRFAVRFELAMAAPKPSKGAIVLGVAVRYDTTIRLGSLENVLKHLSTIDFDHVTMQVDIDLPNSTKKHA